VSINLFIKGLTERNSSLIEIRKTNVNFFLEYSTSLMAYREMQSTDQSPLIISNLVSLCFSMN